MKNSIFLFLYLFFLPAYPLLAQSAANSKNTNEHIASIRISVADTSNNLLFSGQERLKEISKLYRNGKLDEVRLSYKELGKETLYSEYYDMNFDGDVFVYKKKYEDIIHYLSPNVDILQIYGERIKCSTNKQLRTIIRKDSVIFDFRLVCQCGDKENEIPLRSELGVPASYFGNLDKLSSTVEEQFAAMNSTADIDSIVVFRGIVDVRGDMTSLILEAGERSAFSDAVKDVLNSSQKTQTLRAPKRWIPARISRGPVKSNIRIYARLHKDGSVTVSTTRVLGTISVLE